MEDTKFFNELAKATGASLDAELFGYAVRLCDVKHKVAFVFVSFCDKREAVMPGKTNLSDQLDTFEKNGWRLIQIFEDELINSRDVVFSRCLHTCKHTEKTIHGRKCTVIDVAPAEARAFFKANHTQGTGRGGNIFIGLVYDSVLVSCMSFGKARFNKNIAHELIRFASLCGVHVVGGASKLFSAAKKRLQGGVISYADRRYSDGGLYRALGFTELAKSSPCYWYFKMSDTAKKYHRSSFQKHKLSAQLETFDAALTELVNMRNNGWDRVFDSGNYVFVAN